MAVGAWGSQQVRRLEEEMERSLPVKARPHPGAPLIYAVAVVVVHRQAMLSLKRHQVLMLASLGSKTFTLAMLHAGMLATCALGRALQSAVVEARWSWMPGRAPPAAVVT